jgi:hypothetical protein
MNNTASWSTLQCCLFGSRFTDVSSSESTGGDIGGKEAEKEGGKEGRCDSTGDGESEDKGEVQSEYSGSKAGKKKALVKQVLILEHVDVRYRIVTETLDDLTDKPIRR